MKIADQYYAEQAWKLDSGECDAVCWAHEGDGDHVEDSECWCRPIPIAVKSKDELFVPNGYEVF